MLVGGAILRSQSDMAAGLAAASLLIAVAQTLLSMSLKVEVRNFYYKQ